MAERLHHVKIDKEVDGTYNLHLGFDEWTMDSYGKRFYGPCLLEISVFSDEVEICEIEEDDPSYYLR